MGATSRDLGIAAVYNQAVTNLATQRSLGNISQTQFEREMATLEPLRARAGFDTRNARNESSRPQTPTSSAEQTKPQVTDNKLNTENANIQNRGVDRSALSLIKFPATIEADATPYVLIKIFKSAVGTIDQTENDDPTNSIVSGVEFAASGIQNAIDASPAATAVTEKAKQLLGGVSSSLTQLTGDTFNVGAFATKAKDILTNYALRRNIEQLTYAIALTMPENLAVSYQNNFDQLSLTSALGGFGLAAQALASTDGRGENANPFIAEAAGRIAENILNEDFRKLGLFAATGRTVNPQLELIYNSPALRQFTLDFRLIPRNAEESSAIGTILQVLKYQAAPQISAGTSGRYFIPPSQFQLEFYDGIDHAMPNQFLFKTKKCVLEDISIDYSGGGSFTTFYTGAPVEIRLSLKFTETVIIDQNAVAEGF
jgi:hypothetical protein